MTRLRDTFQRATQVYDAAYDVELGRANIDLTPQQLHVLEAIWDEDKPCQTTIVNLTNIDRSTMADIVRRLARKGLISQRRDRKDERRNVLELTTAGKEVTVRAQLIAHNVERDISDKAGGVMSGLETRLKKVIAAAVTDGSRSSLVAAE